MENTENQVKKEKEVCYSYETHTLVSYNPWQEIQENLLYRKLESSFWKINPDICGIPPIYYYAYRAPEELMIYKPSETEVGKGEYYWLRFRFGKWALEKGRYSYAFGGINRGFFRYSEKWEVASVEEGLALLLEKTSGEAHECASEAISRIELFNSIPAEPFDDYGYDFDYYERGFVEEEPAYKQKRMFPWTKHTKRFEEKEKETK